MDNEKFSKFKEEGNKIQKEIKEHSVSYIVAAFGLVAGLAWNEAIKSLIEYLFPLSQNTLWAKFVYAGVLTILIVIIIIYLVKLIGRQKNQ